MLVAQPGLVRVRLELARAFFLKGEDKLARRHFEQVLAGNPPAGVALNVNRFLNRIRARKRWSLNLGAAVAPDTNIGAGSDERIIYIDFAGQLLPFRRDQEELTTSGIGVSAWLGGEYQYPLGDPGTGPGASLWRLRAGGNLSRREYRESQFDQMTLTGHVGPRWLIGRTSEASLLLSGLHQWTGSGIEEPSHHDIGFRVEGRHRMKPADDAERAAVLAPPQIRRAGGSRRAEHRYLGRRGLAGVADAAHRRGPRLGARAHRDRALAQLAPLGAARRDGGAALGLHRRRLGRAALDRIRGRTGSPSCRTAGSAATSPAPSACSRTTGR